MARIPARPDRPAFRSGLQHGFVERWYRGPEGRAGDDPSGNDGQR